MFNEMADAVLGDSDESNCSYSRGYIRQALYSCLTCMKDSKGSVGICLGCSIKCHDGHEMAELYTKRHFRCDCGNSRFPSSQVCMYIADKDHENIENKYNQNFEGKYCSCSRPYPDPEREEEEIMLQCCVCEDWFHEEHLTEESLKDSDETKATSIVPSDYDEMICCGCMKKLDFLRAYNQKPGSETNDDGKEICLLKRLQPNDSCAETTAITPTFWDKAWRSKLCRCSSCKDMYSTKGVEFLIDESDSLIAYEERSKRKRRESPLDAGVRAFSQSLSHSQQVEMAMGYQDMAQNLRAFLATYARSGKVVSEDDIREFFEQFRNSKRHAPSRS